VPSQVPLDVAAFVFLIAGAVAVSIVAERVRIPAAVLLVAVGAVVGAARHVRPPFDFGPAVLFVFLPPLVFEAAWSIDLQALRAQIGRVVLLAVPGTLISALAVAGAAVAIGALPFDLGLLFGAMVAATDPVAVIAAFRRTAVPTAVKTLVEAESLSNDGIGVALYGIALAAATGAAISWSTGIAHAMIAVIGGVAIGCVCAIPLWLALRVTDESTYEVAATVALAYGSYLIADAFKLSGIFATAAGAVMLRALLAQRPHMTNRDDVDVVWNAAAYVGNAIVFLATGLTINAARAIHHPVFIIVSIVVVMVTRIVLACVTVPDFAARVTVVLAGMRGALPLALALSLPATLPQRSEILDGVFAIVLFTLVVQGAPLEPVLRSLYGSARQTSIGSAE
jgi:monovalent cation:H+ antiporter, CPA1 family